MDLLLIIVLSVIFAWLIVVTSWVWIIDSAQDHLMFDILNVLHTISEELGDIDE